MENQIKNFIEEERNESELAVFWDKMASYLPKSIERSALGDEKIFIAFKATYPEIKKHIQISLIKMIVEMVESEKEEEHKAYDCENFESCAMFTRHTRSYNQALDTISSKLKSIINN